MDKERLKLIVRNLKSLVDALESEVHSDLEAYKYENYSIKKEGHQALLQISPSKT